MSRSTVKAKKARRVTKRVSVRARRWQAVARAMEAQA